MLSLVALSGFPISLRWAKTGVLQMDTCVRLCVCGNTSVKKHTSVSGAPLIRDTLSTAGNSMTGFERPSPKPLLKQKRRPQAY